MVIDDLAVTCPQCGAMQDNGPAYTEEETAALQQMTGLLRGERIAWKIGGIVALIASIFLISSGFFLALMGFVLGRTYDSPQTSAGTFVVFGAAAVFWLCVGLLVLLPSAIISLKMAPKAGYYLSAVYTDVAVPRKRCTAVGMIVFCVLFNEVAAIFFIINFVRTKSRAEIFDRIEEKQKNG